MSNAFGSRMKLAVLVIGTGPNISEGDRRIPYAVYRANRVCNGNWSVEGRWEIGL